MDKKLAEIMPGIAKIEHETGIIISDLAEVNPIEVEPNQLEMFRARYIQSTLNLAWAMALLDTSVREVQRKYGYSVWVDISICATGVALHIKQDFSDMHNESATSNDPTQTAE